MNFFCEGKTVTMSSEFPRHYARHAVDGIYSGSSSLVAATLLELQPWMQIDLSQNYNIVEVLYCARTDGYTGE